MSCNLRGIDGEGFFRQLEFNGRYPRNSIDKIRPGMSIFLGTAVAEPRTMARHLMTSDAKNLEDIELKSQPHHILSQMRAAVAEDDYMKLHHLGYPIRTENYTVVR